MGIYEDAIAAFRSGATDRDGRLADAALKSAWAANDIPAQVSAMCMLARVALRNRQLDRVGSFADEARELAREAGTKHLERMPLHMQAVTARMRGAYPTARRLYEESIVLNHSLGEELMVTVESRNLAYVELHDGHADRARELFETALRRAQESGSDGLAPYLALDAAVLAALRGETERAAHLAGVAHEAFKAAGQIPDPDDAAEQTRLHAQLV